jgi:hypothetical protein
MYKVVYRYNNDYNRLYSNMTIISVERLPEYLIKDYMMKDIYTYLGTNNNVIVSYLYMDVSDDKIKVRKDSEFLYNIIGNSCIFA